MRSLISLAACAAVFLAPLSAPAAKTVARTVTYNTSYQQTSPVPTAGEVTGHLRLTFSSDGIVNGTYRDEFGARISTVTGGLNGNKLWLSFGTGGRHQFNGVVNQGGTITGTLSNWRGPRQYRFTAVPSTS